MVTRGGKRIEVKHATPITKNGKTVWQVNIHRHGALDESGVDFYIFRLTGVPESKAAIHLIVPAPLGRPTIAISFRCLLTRWATWFNRTDLLVDTPAITSQIGA